MFRNIIAACLVLFGAGVSQAQNLDRDALKEIQLFAEDFCGDLFDGENSSESLSIDGSAEARLKGILDKLADIGVDGAASFDREKYAGVLREDLGGELKDNRSCRLTIWNDLKGAVVVSTSSAPASAVRPQFLFPFTQTRWIDASELAGYSDRDLRLMRNEIYARHGYIFQSADLRGHFMAQPWYRPSTSDGEAAYAQMSAVEKSNVLTIKDVEMRR